MIVLKEILGLIKKFFALLVSGLRFLLLELRNINAARKQVFLGADAPDAQVDTRSKVKIFGARIMMFWEKLRAAQRAILIGLPLFFIIIVMAVIELPAGGAVRPGSSISENDIEKYKHLWCRMIVNTRPGSNQFVSADEAEKIAKGLAALTKKFKGQELEILERYVGLNRPETYVAQEGWCRIKGYQF